MKIIFIVIQMKLIITRNILRRPRFESVFFPLEIAYSLVILFNSQR